MGYLDCNAESVRGRSSPTAGASAISARHQTQQGYDGNASHPLPESGPGEDEGVVVRVEPVRPPISTRPIEKTRLEGTRAGLRVLGGAW